MLVQGQPTPPDRMLQLEANLTAFAKKNKQLKDKAEIDINTNIKDLAAALAENHNLNIVVDANVDFPFNNVLPDVVIKDLLLLLCKQYSLTLEFTGSIIQIKKYQSPQAPKLEAPKQEPPLIEYNNFNNRLTLGLKEHELGAVLRDITRKSGINVVPSKEVRTLKVNGDIEKSPFREALDLLAEANNLKVNRVRGGSFVLSGADAVAVAPQPNPRPRPNPIRNSNNSGSRLEVIPSNSLDTIAELIAENVSLNAIIKKVSDELDKNYFITSGEEIVSIGNGGRNNQRNNNSNNNAMNSSEGNTILQLRNIAYNDFLDLVLKNSENTYRLENDIYLIGKKQGKSFQTTKIIQLQHRSFSDVIRLIPEKMKQGGVEIDTFPELNSLILSGSSEHIRGIESFVEVVDKTVPNVTIELIIMDAQRNSLVDIGVEAGIGQNPSTSGGQVYPGVDFTFSANAVNNLLDLLAGQGIVNLGQVQPNFYASLTAIEQNGYVKINSKPQLATLNAHPAQFKIGETRYYRNEQSNVTPGITPIINNNFQFEQLEANFAINITPVVSGDEQVTLNISVEQTDFIGEVQENAPSPQVTREFNSIVRVKNGEMIVLGGLERKQTNDTGSGVPWLSRIPIIKWFFSKRSKSKQKTKLLIFVKPTVQF